MVFTPPNHLIWDFWFAPRQVGSDDPYHLFYLQAPRELPDAEMRHERATIGHAVSSDLINWEERGTAFAPAPEGNWDDLAIWTGSIIEHEGRHFFFYTGRSRQDRIQRIGLATSTDPELQEWERYSENPIVVADPRWYEQPDPVNWPDGQACRDPWVTFSEEDRVWSMFFTARANYGPVDSRGVIGLARSTDLLHWEQLPPVSKPGEFGHLEVPQPIELDGTWYLLFCTNLHGEHRRERVPADAGWSGTHYLVGDQLTGPYALSTDTALLADEARTFYAGRMVANSDGQPVLLAWRGRDDDGNFLGALSNPAPLSVLPDGWLHVGAEALWPDGQTP